MNEPFELVELTQPRCIHRFGIAPCTATPADGPRCYNCPGTCLDRRHYNGAGTITWRFVKPGQSLPALYERVGEHLKTDPLPLLADVSLRSSKINVGALRDGERPLGITGGATVTLQDAPFDDPVGDWYRDRRPSLQGSFWTKWAARNPFYGNMTLTLYEGLVGQSLDQMERRLYLVDTLTGPDSQGRVTLTGLDPLRLTDEKKAQFPPETEIQLQADIDAATTTVRVIPTDPRDISRRDLGNTATLYLTIGSEILGYTGALAEADGRFLLQGVTRGQLGTTAASHAAEDACQRCGYLEEMDAWAIQDFLLRGFTRIPPAYINTAGQWDAEAGTYLQGYRFTRAVPKPTGVNLLSGELMRDATFSIWWDEKAQRIPLKAVRPEISTRTLTDAGDFVAGSLEIRREPEERISRATVYFGVIDPTAADAATNFRQSRTRIAADAEDAEAGAEVISKAIFSRWIVSETHAREMLQRLLARFSRTPRYFSAVLVDDSLKIGDVVSIRSRVDVTTEGAPRAMRWQVIAAQRVRPAETTRYSLQEFLYQADRYGVWMAEDAPDFAEAPEALRALGGLWWGGEEGTLPDASPGYLWQ